MQILISSIYPYYFVSYVEAMDWFLFVVWDLFSKELIYSYVYVFGDNE